MISIELIVDYHNLMLIATLIYAGDIWAIYGMDFMLFLLLGLWLHYLSLLWSAHWAEAHYDITTTHFWSIVYVLYVCAKPCVSLVEKGDSSTHYFPHCFAFGLEL